MFDNDSTAANPSLAAAPLASSEVADLLLEAVLEALAHRRPLSRF